MFIAHYCGIQFNLAGTVLNLQYTSGNKIDKDLYFYGTYILAGGDRQ